MLVGGLGTRLLPLTETVPKPLIPLVGRPLVDRLLDLIPHDWEVVFTLSYGSEALSAHLDDRDDSDRFILVDEPEPLGTGGAIRNAAEHLDDTFVVLNGDIVTDLDIRAMLDLHRERDSTGTIALVEVPDPSRFGVVRMENDRIVSFVEKPGSDPPSNLINAGIYVLEPDVIDMIPEGKASIERQVFPRLAEDRLLGFRHEGLWRDVGTLPSYLKAMAALLRLEVEAGRLEESILVASDAVVDSPIEPPATIGSGVRIGRDCRIHNCAILDGAFVADGAMVDTAIVAPGAVLDAGDHVAAAILGTSGERR